MPLTCGNCGTDLEAGADAGTVTCPGCHLTAHL